MKRFYEIALVVLLFLIMISAILCIMAMPTQADPLPRDYVIIRYVKTHGTPYSSTYGNAWSMIYVWQRSDHALIILFTLNPKTGYWEVAHSYKLGKKVEQIKWCSAMSNKRR